MVRVRKVPIRSVQSSPSHCTGGGKRDMQTQTTNHAITHAALRPEILEALRRDTASARGLPNEAFTTQDFLDLEVGTILREQPDQGLPAGDVVVHRLETSPLLGASGVDLKSSKEVY